MEANTASVDKFQASTTLVLGNDMHDNIREEEEEREKVMKVVETKNRKTKPVIRYKDYAKPNSYKAHTPEQAEQAAIQSAQAARDTANKYNTLFQEQGVHVTASKRYEEVDYEDCDFQIKYRGETLRDKPSGWGHLETSHESGMCVREEGQWLFGCAHGLSKQVRDDGMIIVGHVLYNRHVGASTITLSNGTTYEGDTINSREYGYGISRGPRGYEFRGQFKKGWMHGFGIEYRHKRVIRKGFWSRSKFVGKGPTPPQDDDKNVMNSCGIMIPPGGAQIVVDDEAANRANVVPVVLPGEKQCASCLHVKNKKNDFSNTQAQKAEGKCKLCVCT